MGGSLNNLGLQGNTDDTEVRVLIEPRTVPYNRIEPYPYRIDRISTANLGFSEVRTIFL
jgi:hypothetical protein